MKLTRRSAPVARSLAGVALFAAASLALPSDGSAGLPPGSDPPSFSDETVGTLPSYWEDDEDWYADIYDLDGSLVEELGMLSYEVWVPVGEFDEDLVISADGHGFVLLSLVGEYDALLRMRFFGDVRIVLDERLFESSGSDLRIAVGAAFAGGTADAFWKGQVLKSVGLGPLGSAVAIDVAHPKVAGMIHQSPLAIVSDGPGGYAAASTLAGDGWRLRLAQGSQSIR